MCGVGAKSVGHLMKFHLLQSEVVKVKFLMNSNMTLTVLNLHQKTDPKVQQEFLKVKVTTTRSKVKSRSHHDAAHLHPLTNVPTKYQLPTPYGFRDIARTRFYRSRSLQTFSCRPPNHAPIQTPWVKTIPRQPLRAVG